MRLVVDAERLLDDLEAWAVASSRTELRALLDREAAGSPLAVAAASENMDYVRQLRGGPARPVYKTADLELLVPEELAARWRIDAAAAGSTLDAWIERQLARATAGNPVPWEIAAAAACQTLSEWCYASALRRLASRTA